MHEHLLNASSRVALAALLHDLGKFAERARIPEAQTKDADGNTRRDLNTQLYCPSPKGRHTHIHAAYTAIAFDLLERDFPELVGEEMTPFAPWRNKNADDSIINAAARHHRPETFLQWVIATADRLASGFEREEFAAYNEADDETRTKKNHYTARQLTLLETIRLTPDQSEKEKFDWRYPLKPLAPSALFPVKAEGYEKDGNVEAQEEYRALWEQFIAALQKIPQAHRRQLPLWLDHFESLWLTFTQAIPAATSFNIKPDVSLYDHSKAVAALAVALWRWHHDNQNTGQPAQEQLRVMWGQGRKDSEEARRAWDEKKFLLIQGDFFGIQDFIFTTGGETQRQAAKLLRGRSFYVSLLTECAALKVLDALDLPSTSQVTNAAGKFLIVAPNTISVIEKLQSCQTELNKWFLQHTFGESGIGLAWLPASAADFRSTEGDRSPFRILIKCLFEQLEETKLKRFSLCGALPAPVLFTEFLDQFDNTKGVCAVDGRSPGTVKLEKERDAWASALAADHIQIGKWLAGYDRLLITRESLEHHTLKVSIFGYWVSFTESEGVTGGFSREAETGNLVRAWDFSLPQLADAPLWNGYARRSINAYIPRFGDLGNYDEERYKGLEKPESEEEPKTLNHLACDDIVRVVRDDEERLVGEKALMTFKGDVDNLGQIFQKGLEKPTFAKMAALSRQMNAFFSIWLPWKCQSEFPNTYTVFAGGDDFFLIGPWHSTIKLAQHMRQDFEQFVAQNSDIHFSAGLSMTKPKLPIRHLAEMAEEALEQAKALNPAKAQVLPKNAVTCFGIPTRWSQFEDLLKREATLKQLTQRYPLSTGYLYGLLNLIDLAEKVGERPENAIWHSRFAYRTTRLAEMLIKSGESRDDIAQQRRAFVEDLASEIACNGIEKFKEAYKVALFIYLYQRRD